MQAKGLTIGASLLLFSGSALAFHCPKDMQRIDAALQTHTAPGAAERDQVRRLRAEGEALHAAGRHRESTDTLARARRMPGAE